MADTPKITGLALFALALGLLALLTPLRGAESPPSAVGWLLALAAAVEMLHALRRSTAAARRRAVGSAIISLIIAFFLIGAPYVATQASAFWWPAGSPSMPSATCRLVGRRHDGIGGRPALSAPP
jgi:uncharacterized membrane protein HdeD (DUF308 family)